MVAVNVLCPNVNSVLEFEALNYTGDVVDIYINVDMQLSDGTYVAKQAYPNSVANSASLQEIAVINMPAGTRILNIDIGQKANPPVFIETRLLYNLDTTKSIYRHIPEASGWIHSSANKYGSKFSDYATWAYRAVITQEHTTSYAIMVTVVPGAGNHMLVNSCVVGPDDYAGARTIALYKFDANNVTASDFGGLSVDNQKHNFPHAGNFAADGYVDSTEPENRRIVGTDKFVVYTQAAGIVESETLTISIRSLIRSAIPTVTITTTTYSSSVTYNKVI